MANSANYTVAIITNLPAIDGQGASNTVNVGTGIFIAPDEILTATHVVYDSATGLVPTVIQIGLGSTIVQGSLQGGTQLQISDSESNMAAQIHHNNITDANGIIPTAVDISQDYAIIHLNVSGLSGGGAGLAPDSVVTGSTSGSGSATVTS